MDKKYKRLNTREKGVPKSDLSTKDRTKLIIHSGIFNIKVSTKPAASLTQNPAYIILESADTVTADCWLEID